ncbi:hypothetical protein H5V45_17780 [Nocardioides sp. KIGAM211]|uniref:STAS domain-containing protein n=1 Tax=Nocardioides luti TaxID=2761101 RepID=A0A7X0RJ13_9ACTN|nr:hypothetical protein [Nocardioides luti]MBB6629182.1 hypothetical protein [Nocardioides luti]
MDTTFATHYDPGTSTLELTGTFDHAAWALVDAEIDRAFRRTACRLTIDLSRATDVPPHAVGRLVHLCNCAYPGTIVRVASRSRAAVQVPAPVAA